MSEVYVKHMHRGRDLVVAVCDAEILGKTLLGGKVPFTVNEGFYEGILGTIDEAIMAMKQASICNIVGKRIVEAAIRNKLIHERAVIYFGDIPHAQRLKL
jgi:hypothetical protein